MASSSSGAFEALPVLDVGLLRSGLAADEARFVASLREACHVTGFFYVSNLALPAGLEDRVFAAARAFFALPLERKRALDKVHSPHFRGYTVLGDEITAGRRDHREQIDLGFEAPARDAAAAAALPLYWQLQGPNLWPAEAECPGFRAAVTEFMHEMHKLALRLMEAIALSLELPRDYFAHSFGEMPHTRLKLVRYPPPSAEDVAAGTAGVGPHKDYGHLAILLQDGVGGLQVLNGAGRWIDATPLPGTAVVNLGEMLEQATGGYYVATVHRVINRSDRERYSVPYFASPRLETRLEPLPLPDSFRAAAAARAHAGANARYAKENPIYPVYGETAWRGLARSHPDVLQRHYPGVPVPPSGPTYG
jgi:isopenicillin N synthase-like dioxygenase